MMVTGVDAGCHFHHVISLVKILNAYRRNSLSPSRGYLRAWHNTFALSVRNFAPSFLDSTDYMYLRNSGTEFNPCTDSEPRSTSALQGIIYFSTRKSSI